MRIILSIPVNIERIRAGCMCWSQTLRTHRILPRGAHPPADLTVGACSRQHRPESAVGCVALCGSGGRHMETRLGVPGGRLLGFVRMCLLAWPEGSPAPSWVPRCCLPPAASSWSGEWSLLQPNAHSLLLCVDPSAGSGRWESPAPHGSRSAQPRTA